MPDQEAPLDGQQAAAEGLIGRHRYLDPAVLSRLGGFNLLARRVVEGFISGLHKSPHHGFSVEFAEHREYAPGDDLRRLDWKVFGRTDKYYLKQFEEETNLVCHLLLDASESMGYRSDAAPMPKLEYAQRAAAALAYLVLHQQDSVGLVAFDSEIRSLVRAGGNPSHLKEILHAMEGLSAERKTAAGAISAGVAKRPNGILRRIFSYSSGAVQTLRVKSVLTYPGAMALTRTP